MSSGSDLDRDGVDRVINDAIRPLLRVHGGDILLLGTDDGYVELEFQGACRGCALKVVTYAIGVRERLIHLAGVKSVRVRGVNLSDAALKRVSAAYADFPFPGHRSEKAFDGAPRVEVIRNPGASPHSSPGTNQLTAHSGPRTAVQRPW